MVEHNIQDSIKKFANEDVPNITDELFSTNRAIKNYAITSRQIGIGNKLTKEEKNKFIQEFIKEIFQKLENKQLEENQNIAPIVDENAENGETTNVENMEKSEKILVIDRFEGKFAICEDRETREMLNILIDELPDDIHEGDVLKFKNGKYELDEEMKLEIEERINNRLKDLFED